MAAELPRVEIRNHGSAMTEILIDGKPLHGVISYTLEQDGGSQPILTLRMKGVDMSVDSVMIPALPAYFEGFYEESESVREAKAVNTGHYVC